MLEGLVDRLEAISERRHQENAKLDLQSVTASLHVQTRIADALERIADRMECIARHGFPEGDDQ